MNKYIDAEKLKAEIERQKKIDGWCEVGKDTADVYYARGFRFACDNLSSFIDSLQQEQPEGNLEYWLEHFGMPKGNIDNCITQIAQGYGACRYLEGIQHGAEAVNELAKQEQPEGGCSEKPNNLLSEWTEPRKTRKQEQPEVDLEKEIDACWQNWLSPLNQKEVEGVLPKIEFATYARHFYELGRNARKEE